jgi:hypothetical protein
MFDYIEVDRKWQPEPRPQWVDVPGVSAQTKSLSCFLSTYRIDAEGLLWVSDWDDEEQAQGPWWLDTFSGDIQVSFYPAAGRREPYEIVLTVSTGRVVGARVLSGDWP